MKNPHNLFCYNDPEFVERETSTQESTREQLIIVDDVKDGIVSGTEVCETTTPDGRISITKKRTLVKTCIGCLVTTDPEETRYPYYAGECHKGHPTCSNHLHYCDHPGCGRAVCPRDGAEYKPGHYKCQKHFRLYRLWQVAKFFLSPFIRFHDGGNHG